MPSVEAWLLLDFIGLSLFIVWASNFYPFILSRPPGELDTENQNELLFYAASLTFLLVWGGIATKYGRHQKLGLFLRDSWNHFVGQSIFSWNVLLRFLRQVLDFCPPFLSTPVRQLNRILHTPNVCYIGNVVFDVIIVGCLMSLFAIIFIYLTTGEDISFCMSHFGLMFVYFFLSKVFFDEYTVNRLVLNFAYGCFHLGVLYEYFGYETSYLATHTGIAIFILDIIWHFLNPSSSEEMLHESSVHIKPPDESSKQSKKTLPKIPRSEKPRIKIRRR